MEVTRIDLVALMQGAIRDQTSDDVSFACFLLPTSQNGVPKQWCVTLSLDDSEESIRRYATMLKVVRFVMGQHSSYCSAKNMKRHAHWDGQDFYRAIIAPLTKAKILTHEGRQLYRAGEHANAFVKKDYGNV